MTLLRISVGKDESIRPADLVGAIAGEAKIPSGVIGAIKIHDDYSLVEIPDELAERVITALQAHPDPRSPRDRAVEAGALGADHVARCYPAVGTRMLLAQPRRCGQGAST